MVRSRMITLAAISALTVASTVAVAGNPHFIKNLTSVSQSGANLTVEFKEAGLPSGATETVTLSCTEAVTYECVNGGGKNPAASNKSTFKTQAGTSGEFTADQNGNIVGQLTLSPLTAADLGFSCPPGQRTTFVSVVYSGCSLSDEDSGATLPVSGSFSYTNPNAPPVR